MGGGSLFGGGGGGGGGEGGFLPRNDHQILMEACSVPVGPRAAPVRRTCEFERYLKETR